MTLSSEGYRREAQRLYELAGSLPFGDVRTGLHEVARQYEALARHAAVMESRSTTELRDSAAPTPAIRPVPER